MKSQPPLHVATPVRQSLPLTKVAGTPVYLKLDSSQPTGSFKIRGIGHLCKTVSNSPVQDSVDEMLSKDPYEPVWTCWTCFDGVLVPFVTAMLAFFPLSGLSKDVSGLSAVQVTN